METVEQLLARLERDVAAVRSAIADENEGQLKAAAFDMRVAAYELDRLVWSW